MSEPSPTPSSAPGPLVSAAAIAVLATALAAGVPLAANSWRSLSKARARAEVRASHLAQAARHVRDGRYDLATVGYRKAKGAAITDPGVEMANDHLLVLNAVRSPGLLTGKVRLEAEYVVERALARPIRLPHKEYYLAAQGAVQAARGDIDGALASFDQAIAIDAEFAPVRYFKGKVLADTHKPNEAEPELMRAIDLDPKNGLAYKRLAQLRSDGGLLASAAQQLEKAIELGPDAEAHFLLGVVRAKQGKHEDALQEFVEVGNIRRDYPKLARNLGLTLFQLKRWQESARILTEVFRRSQDINIYFYIGRAMKELGDRQKAANIFKTIVDSRPSHADATFELAQLLDEGGQQAHARHYYGKFVELASGRKNLASQERLARLRLEQLRNLPAPSKKAPTK